MLTLKGPMILSTVKKEKKKEEEHLEADLSLLSKPLRVCVRTCCCCFFFSPSSFHPRLTLKLSSQWKVIKLWRIWIWSPPVRPFWPRPAAPPGSRLSPLGSHMFKVPVTPNCPTGETGVARGHKPSLHPDVEHIWKGCWMLLWYRFLIFFLKIFLLSVF